MCDFRAKIELCSGVDAYRTGSLLFEALEEEVLVETTCQLAEGRYVFTVRSVPRGTAAHGDQASGGVLFRPRPLAAQRQAAVQYTVGHTISEARLETCSCVPEA